MLPPSVQPLAAEFLRDNLWPHALPALPFHRGNWSGSHAALGRFDLIIASNVLYDRLQPKTNARFIDGHATHAVKILVIDPDRGHQTKFAAPIKTFGYARERTRFACTGSSATSYKGRMFAYAR